VPPRLPPSHPAPGTAVPPPAAHTFRARTGHRSPSEGRQELHGGDPARPRRAEVRHRDGGKADVAAGAVHRGARQRRRKCLSWSHKRSGVLKKSSDSSFQAVPAQFRPEILPKSQSCDVLRPRCSHPHAFSTVAHDPAGHDWGMKMVPQPCGATDALLDWSYFSTRHEQVIGTTRLCAAPAAPPQEGWRAGGVRAHRRGPSVSICTD
jgi:hypothetical protein